jgi:hypothetical protein
MATLRSQQIEISQLRAETASLRQQLELLALRQRTEMELQTRKSWYPDPSPHTSFDASPTSTKLRPGSLDQVGDSIPDGLLASLLELPSSIPRSALESSKSRAQILDHLPVFHRIWAELWSLTAQIQNLRVDQFSNHRTSRSPSRGRSPSLSASSSPRHFPASELLQGVHASQSFASFIPTIGADVCTSKDPCRSGVTIQRLVRGASLHAAGVSVGDTIVACNHRPVNDPLTLHELTRAVGAPGESVVLEVVPVGRTRAMPLVVRVALMNIAP